MRQSANELKFFRVKKIKFLEKGNNQASLTKLNEKIANYFVIDSMLIVTVAFQLSFINLEAIMDTPNVTYLLCTLHITLNEFGILKLYCYNYWH